VLSLASPFGDLAGLRLADLALMDIAENTKDNYRDDLRVHVRPFITNYAPAQQVRAGGAGVLPGGDAVKPRSARHSIPGRSRPSSSPDSSFSDVEYRPIAASNIAWVPHSANATTRA
jgi:hypothetical protein